MCTTEEREKEGKKKGGRKGVNIYSRCVHALVRPKNLHTGGRFPVREFTSQPKIR